MLEVKITYFLSNEGADYFPHWYAEVYAIASQQQGFSSMKVEYNATTPTVYLNFQNYETLALWKKHPEHDELVEKINHFCTQAKHVEVTESNRDI